MRRLKEINRKNGQSNRHGAESKPVIKRTSTGSPIRTSRNATQTITVKSRTQSRQTNVKQSPSVFRQETLLQRKEYRKNKRSLFHWQWTYHYLMVGFSLLMSALGVLMCGLDLAFGWPLFRASLLFDVVLFVGSAIMLALSWSVYRDLPKIARYGYWHRCDGMQRNADGFNMSV